MVAPRGHCAGQSIATMYSYNNRHRIGWDKDLYGRYDNDWGEPTPNFWPDDAKIIRLSSALQYKMLHNWRWEWEGKLKPYAEILGEDDELTFYVFAYAMQMTGEPQFIYISQSSDVEPDSEKRGAHALIAYKIEKDTIYLSDPNHPNEERALILEREFEEKPSFSKIYAAINANEDAVPYDEIGFFGVFSLVDKSTAFKYWNQVKEGGPVAEDLFPEDIQLEVALERNDQGQIVTTIIPDDVTLTNKGTSSIGSKYEGMFYFRFAGAPSNVKQDVIFYRGQERIDLFNDNGWWYFPLEIGVNELGLLYRMAHPGSGVEGLRFVNFYRFTVLYVDKVEEKEEVEEEENLTEKWEIMVWWESIDLLEGHGGLEEHREETEADYRKYLIGEKQREGSFYLEPEEDGYRLIKEGDYDRFDYDLSPPNFLWSYETEPTGEKDPLANVPGAGMEVRGDLPQKPTASYYTAAYEGQFESEKLITGTIEKLDYRALYTMDSEGEVDNIAEYIPQWDGEYHFQGFQPAERKAGVFEARKTDP